MSTTANNTPIDQLLAEYEAENCDFRDVDFLVSASYRYVQTMPDSQVRCLLYSLAKMVDKHIPEEIRRPIAVPNPLMPTYRKIVNDALEAAGTEISALLGYRDTDIKLKSTVRKSKYKNGGESLKMSIHVEVPWSAGRHDFKKIVHRHVNKLMEANGYEKALMVISSGSAAKFIAKVVLPGDDDYEKDKRFSFYHE